MPFPVEIRFVRDAEAKLGRRLPLGYVAAICKLNGGCVSVERDTFYLHTVLDTSDRKRIARTCNDIVRETASAKTWPDFPADAVAIGENGGGDRLVFLPDPDGVRYADAVYWWDHETGSINRVADMFEDLKHREG